MAGIALISTWILRSLDAMKSILDAVRQEQSELKAKVLEVHAAAEIVQGLRATISETTARELLA